MNAGFRKFFVFSFLTILALTFALVGASTTWAQAESGQISGTVTDATGAVVADANVTVKSVNTGFTREATTNSSGIYTVTSLKPDLYEVTIESRGFQKLVRRVEVAVGSSNEVSLQLTVGGAAETVEVMSSTGDITVNTENQTLSETITARDIDMLPTSPTRNPYALVGTSGNVTEDSNSNRGAGFAINGQRSSSTDILLDGSENVDTFTATVGQTIPLDSVQEFSVLTNNFTAEYGRASGGVVNLVTKSGTNTFHGSAYEFNRVSALSANTFQNDTTDTPKGVFTRNDFGFAVGGPVKKNKIFFFNNTEWIRVRSSAPQDYNIIDPASYASLAQPSQDFFTAYGALSPDAHVIASGPCSDTLSGSPNCQTVVFNVPADAGGGNPQNTVMDVARVDFNLTDRTSLFVRYASYNEIDAAGVVNSSPYAGYNTGQTNFDQNITLNLNHVFSPSLVNTAKVTFNRLNGPVQPLGAAPVSPTLYTSSNTPAINLENSGDFPLIFPGYSQTTPGNAIPFGGPQNLYQFYDDLSWTKGKHQFKFGGQFVQLRDNRVFGAYENPTELLGTTLDSGLQGLLNGTIFQFSGAVSPQGKFPCVRDIDTGAPIVTPECTLTLPVGPPAFNRNYRYNDGAVYAQDAFKVFPRFTINLGVRWEYYGVQHNANPSLDSNFVLGSGSTIFDQIRNGSVELAKDGGEFWKPKYHNFGPRVGFAWDIFGNGKTSLRGGYSISYERNFGNVTFNAIQNPPAYAVVNLQSGVDVPGDLPVFTDPAGPLAGTGTKPLPSVSQRAINQNLASAYAETFNLAIERQVGKGVFSVYYAGSHGVHLYDIANINLARYGGTFLGDTRAANRLNLQYGAMNYRSDQGYSHYNAMNVKYAITEFRGTGLGLNVNYTYSHALDNLSSAFTDGTPSFYNLGYIDAFNPKLNYGNSDFDIRHRFNLSATWQSPWFQHSEHSFVRTALGGWGVGSIFSIRSGSPFSIYDCNNFNGQACPLYVPDVAVPFTGSAKSAGGNSFNYITLPSHVDNSDPLNPIQVVNNQGVSLGIPNCTGLDHVGCTYTTNGQGYPDRNQFFGPSFWNLDMNFYKSFKITERFGLQFRAELYNILNHHNQYVNAFGLDVSSITAAPGDPAPAIQTEKGGIFGIAGAPSDERRNIQFGLKLTF